MLCFLSIVKMSKYCIYWGNRGYLIPEHILNLNYGNIKHHRMNDHFYANTFKAILKGLNGT